MSAYPTCQARLCDELGIMTVVASCCSDHPRVEAMSLCEYHADEEVIATAESEARLVGVFATARRWGS